MQLQNINKGWIAGAASVVFATIGAILYVRYNNQKVIDNIISAANNNSDPLTGESMINGGNTNYGDYRDLAISSVFSPTYWKKNPGKVTIWNITSNKTEGPATKIARQIYDAQSAIPLNDKPEQVVAAFKQLRSKEDVSKLSDVFNQLYKKDLYNYLNQSWMHKYCSADQNECFFGANTNYFKQVYDWIKYQLV